MLNKTLLPFLYIAIMGITFAFVAIGANEAAGYWLGGTVKQIAAISFWVIAVAFGYFAIRFDAALTALAVSLASAAFSVKQEQRYYETLGVNTGLTEIFVENLIAFFTAYLIIFCLFSIVNIAIRRVNSLS